MAAVCAFVGVVAHKIKTKINKLEQHMNIVILDQFLQLNQNVNKNNKTQINPINRQMNVKLFKLKLSNFCFD